LEFDAELPLENVTPELHQALSLLEPFGMDNAEPIFAARSVRVMAPPQAVKDKHVRLKVAPATEEAGALGREWAVGTPALEPRCHPDSAAIPKRNGTTVVSDPTLSRKPSWRRNITFKAMGWGLKESCDRLQLLAGDRLDIAYSLGMNDHPEFGGLELSLQDVKRSEHS
jgi:single-stranded-DNA-specific exonuclease